jgi:site-specific DNA-methyltransferase (adenine-specific)
LHLGDCIDGLKTLDDKSVDHLITDPPYSEHVHANSVRGDGHRAGGILTPLFFAPLRDEVREEIARQAARLVRRWVIVFSDLESAHLWRESLERHGLEFVRTGLWVKENATPQFTGDRPAVPAEAITIAHSRGKKRWNGGGKPAVWRCATSYSDGDKVIHTTQKPMSLMESLVRDFTDADELILDPFAGSGTTLAAAIRNGRRATGWEREAHWHEAAIRRLNATREQLDLFYARR